MQFATYKFPHTDVLKQTRFVEEVDGWWVRFGDDVFVYTANEKWGAVTSRLKTSDRDERQASGSVSKNNMHLVLQKGRTFQQENPDVKVILDKGRYLVVDLVRSAAKKLAGRKDPCFHIEPLKQNSVVFETVARDSVTDVSNKRVESIVAELEQSVYKTTISQIVSYSTRFSTSPDYADAANWAIDTLEGLGYVTASVPISIANLGQSCNVIAVKTGTGGVRRGNVLIVGHLDSVNYPGGVSASAPGADDNASGSAGVIVMASVLSTHRFKNDLTFVLFGGEEQGLHGSMQYVAGLSDIQRDRIIAVLNMDMIGTINTSSPTVLLEGAELSQKLINKLLKAAATYTSLNIQTSLNPFASDHVPFIEAEIPAVLTIEGTDNANDAIHTGKDTLDRVNDAYAIEILRMNLGFVTEQAVLVEHPTAGCGCSDQKDFEPETTEAVRVLISHYQNLFAQYSRLNRDGRINDQDFANWQTTRAMHDMFVSIEAIHTAAR